MDREHGNKLIAEFLGWRFDVSKDGTVTAFFEEKKRWVDDEKTLKELLASENECVSIAINHSNPKP